MSTKARRFTQPELQFRHGRLVPRSKPDRCVKDQSGEGSSKSKTGDRNVKINRLMLSGHSPRDLSAAFLNFVSKRDQDLTCSQRYGISQFRALVAETSNQKSNLEDENLMLQYYHIFDNVFFGGSLLGLCKIIFRQPEEMPENTLADTTSPETTLSYRKYIPDNYAALIRLTILAPRRNLDYNAYEVRHKAYLETLLHEMTHAYFGIYVCMCNNSCQGLYEELIGEWGHRKCWQEAALALEKATLPLLGMALGMDIKLNVSCDPGKYSSVLELETLATFDNNIGAARSESFVKFDK